jgi:hypothetical protein
MDIPKPITKTKAKKSKYLLLIKWAKCDSNISLYPRKTISKIRIMLAIALPIPIPIFILLYFFESIF